MFLLELRNRVLRRWTDRPDQRPGIQRQPESTVRQQRAELVYHLQNEVHRLQLEIADLSLTRQRNAGTEERITFDAQIAGLETELVQAQQGLARLQARV